MASSHSLAVSPQDRVNQRIYQASNIARFYRSDQLDHAETMALLAYQPAFAGRDVLDLGVGTGRTSRFLAPLAGRYACLDSSAPMIQFLRERFPGLHASLADMRDLSGFATSSYDFVLASCNLIDAVSHDDRLRVLAEVRRVLRPEGTFMFSSHNRRLRTAQSGPRMVWDRNPVTQALQVLRFFRSWVNHARVGRLRRFEQDYALLNDPGHDYAALHYYVDRQTQRRQLDAAGFQLLDVFDSAGRRLAPGDDDQESPSLLYVAVVRAAATSP
jgi:SAM-dependent methyltransferase